MSHEQFKRHIILDANVFQLLTKERTSQQRVEGVLAELNSRAPALIVGIPGIIPQYLGIERPSYLKTSAEVAEPLISAWKDSLEAGQAQLRRSFLDLISHYTEQQRGILGNYRATVDRFLHDKVSAIPAARQIAEDILTMRGMPLTDDQMVSELAAFYAFDELAAHVKDVLFSDGRIQRELFLTMLSVCVEYRHLNFYRLIESLLFALEQEAKAHKNVERKRHLFSLKHGISQYKVGEADDGLWLWLAFQGSLGDAGPLPVSVLTFDKKNVKRARCLEGILAEKIGDATILDLLRSQVTFIPGEVLVFGGEPPRLASTYAVCLANSREEHKPI
jgi:hypothetical protein